jgi:hypothetical protein
MDEVVLPILIDRVQTRDKFRLEILSLKFHNITCLVLIGKPPVITPLLKYYISKPIIQLVKFNLFIDSVSKQ